MNTDPTRQRSLELFQAIARQFDKEGLRDLCYVLGVDYDDLPAEGKSNVARELVRMMERRGRLNELEQAVEQMAPRGRQARGPRNRRVMIERVRRSWVQGVLEGSLYHVARVELGLQDQPEAVERPWAMIMQEQNQPPRQLAGVPGQPAQGARMGQVFDELGGALLILGAPGTGKTTLLLELVSDLLDRAGQDPGHPIPVVFHLSSWAVARKALAEWMVDELDQRYDVPRKQGRAWIEGQAILPLLDGLDEVAGAHRDACAEAINAYRQEHGLVSMAVCSRTEEYEALATRLRLQGAVAIQPLTREQGDVYLEGAGPSLSGVRAALRADETLYELLDTPLMVSVVALACRGESASDLQRAGTVDERRDRLFAAYVGAMHKRRGSKAPCTREQADRWLSWLARQMRAHEQSVFLLERMQPDWLPEHRQRRWVIGVPAIISGLVGGLVYGLVFGLVYGLVYGLVVGLAVGLFFRWLGGRVVGPAGRPIEPAETLHWSWSEARQRLGVGLLYGLVCGLGVGLFGGLVYGLVYGLVCGLGVGLFGGLVTGEMIGREKPNEGMRRSARSALVSGLVGGLVGGLAGGLLGGLVGGLLGGLLVGLGVGLIKGGRACLRHLVLRSLLVRNDLAPWNYAAFLDHAAERILLRRVGGGYIFVHRMLLDWFAGKWPAYETEGGKATHG